MIAFIMSIDNERLDDLVDEWHDSQSDQPLAEYMADALGWSVDDVRSWIADPRCYPLPSGNA